MAKIARKTRAGKVIIIGNPPLATIEIIEVRGRNVSFVYRGEYSIEIDDIPDSPCQTTENPAQ
jgi:DNA/RNA endonuclease YhcR with UshA esterase domain